MRPGLLKAIIVLPGSVLVFVPAGLVMLSRTMGNVIAPATLDDISFWLALVMGGMGGWLAWWSVRSFLHHAGGTPAPWQPPDQMVVAGPYRYVRNPMITGVLLVLAAETLWFNSWLLLAWTLVFWLANLAYFPLVEEKSLEKRFGEAYRQYAAHVPRWLPRLVSWPPDGQHMSGGD